MTGQVRFGGIVIPYESMKDWIAGPAEQGA